MSGPPPKPKPSILGLPPVPFKKLYTYANRGDRVKVGVSCFCGAASGAILPLFSLVFGKALNTLNDPFADVTAEINKLALYFLWIAIGASFLTFCENFLNITTTEIQMRRLREAYCQNILRLDFAWYDNHRTGKDLYLLIILIFQSILLAIYILSMIQISL